MKRLTLALLLALLSVAPAPAAPETWYEITSPHFTVWANANDKSTRTLLWQLEQIRGTLAALWPWAQVDPIKPMLVMVPKDENGLKALAPEFWERNKGGSRPGGVWVSGADRHYMVIRGDLQGSDKILLNPHTSIYFSYVHLILQSSFGQDLPLWFVRGLSGVLSNTVVHDKEILFGPPIPWHLEALREQSRLTIKDLLAVKRSSPEYTQRLDRFDAESWAFVHFLMFGANGAQAPRLNRFVSELRAGRNPDTAFTEILGRPEDYETPFVTYIKGGVFAYQKTSIDEGVVKEKFPSLPITAARAAAGQAVFHVAMGRPAEAKALVDTARASNPAEPDAFLAEALQFDRNGQQDDAKAAYLKAVNLGSSNAYPYYRWATLNWPRPGPETLKEMDARLSRAVELNPSFASAYAHLAQVRARSKQPAVGVMSLVARAIKLEPLEPWHRIVEARILLAYRSVESARKAAQAALTLADDDEVRQAAQDLLVEIQRAEAEESKGRGVGA